MENHKNRARLTIATNLRLLPFSPEKKKRTRKVERNRIEEMLLRFGPR